MSSSNDNAGKAPSKFENLLSCHFHGEGGNSFRVQVTLIDGKPYIGFSKYFQSRKDMQWYPGRAPFFMPLAAWKGLIPRFAGIAKRINGLGLSGMFLFS